MLHGLENFSRSILFDEEFESALRFLKKSKAIFSVCDVITRKVYLIGKYTIKYMIETKLKIIFNHGLRGWLCCSSTYYRKCLKKKKQQHRKKKIKTREVWVKALTRRGKLGICATLVAELRMEELSEYTRFFRMPPPSFDELLSLIEGDISKQ